MSVYLFVPLYLVSSLHTHHSPLFGSTAVLATEYYRLSTFWREKFSSLLDLEF